MPRCGSCNAQIEWVKTQHAKRPMPVDPGYVTIVEDPAGRVVIVTDGGRIVRGTDRAPDVDLNNLDATAQLVRGRVSHFASCPHAAQHRRS